MSCKQALFSDFSNGTGNEASFLKSFVTGLRRTLTYHVFVYRFWLRSLISNAQLEICLDIYEAQETLYLRSQRCASASWRSEENMTDKSLSRSRRSTTDQAVITHYAPPLESFWTNPLIVVGEAPCLLQTGYKAYSYSPWAVITLSRICDANWHLSCIIG